MSWCGGGQPQRCRRARPAPARRPPRPAKTSSARPHLRRGAVGCRGHNGRPRVRLLPDRNVEWDLPRGVGRGSGARPSWQHAAVARAETHGRPGPRLIRRGNWPAGRPAGRAGLPARKAGAPWRPIRGRTLPSTSIPMSAAALSAPPAARQGRAAGRAREAGVASEQPRVCTAPAAQAVWAWCPPRPAPQPPPPAPRPRPACAPLPKGWLSCPQLPQTNHDMFSTMPAMGTPTCQVGRGRQERTCTDRRLRWGRPPASKQQGHSGQRGQPGGAGSQARMPLRLQARAAALAPQQRPRQPHAVAVPAQQQRACAPCGTWCSRAARPAGQCPGGSRGRRGRAGSGAQRLCCQRH